MAKPTFPEFKLPEFKVPELKMPKVDLDALFGLQKANLAVAYEAQTVLVDAFQAIVRLQHDYALDVAADREGRRRDQDPGQARDRPGRRQGRRREGGRRDQGRRRSRRRRAAAGRQPGEPTASRPTSTSSRRSPPNSGSSP